MKENIDIISSLVAMAGAFLRALKNKFSKKETIINLIVAGVLAFGIIELLILFLPKWFDNTRIMTFVSFFVGWVTRDFTDKIERVISDIYDIFLGYLKSKFNKNK